MTYLPFQMRDTKSVPFNRFGVSRRTYVSHAFRDQRLVGMHAFLTVRGGTAGASANRE
jgi:hypothetical protein